MGRWTWWDNLTFGVDPYSTGAHIDAGPETFTTNQIVIGDTYLMSPATILDLRASWTRFRYDRSPASQGIDLTQFAWPSSLVSQIPENFRHIPTPCVESYGLFCSQGTGSIIIGRQENLALLPSLTLIRGRHTFKIGGDVRRLTHNYAQSNTPSGIFDFNSKFTADDPFNPVGGWGFASFLLGTGSSNRGITTPGLVAGQMIYRAAYINDQWQVNDRLTVNVGVRWERSGNFSERFDNMTALALDSVNPLSSETGLDLRGQLALVSSDLRTPRTRLDDRHAFAPRLGIAYRLDDKTVIRTGYGIFWLPNDVAFAVAPNQDVVNTIGTPWISSLDGGVTPYRLLSDPFPDGVLLPPGRDTTFLNTLVGGLGIRSPVPNQPLGYMQQWNFNLQRQLPDGTLVDVAYAGSKGTSLPVNAQTLNQLPDEHLSLGKELNEQVPNPFHGTSIATGPLSQPTVARGQLLRPYPQFTNVEMSGPTNRSSTYHSFQAKVERRFSGGASLLATYTASKLITDAGTLTGWLDGLEGFSAQGWATGGNNNDLRSLKSLAAFDVSQRFVLSYVLDLPFGKGKPFGSNLSGVANKIVGGWGVNGVTTVQRGFPIGVTTSRNLSNSFGGSQFPNNNGTSAELSGDPQTRLGEYFRTDVFSQPPAFTFGNTARVLPDVRGPGIAQWDFAIFKRTQIGEQVGVEFRTEFFNLFNTPIFRHPGSSLGTPQFGVISGTRGVPRLIQFWTASAVLTRAPAALSARRAGSGGHAFRRLMTRGRQRAIGLAASLCLGLRLLAQPVTDTDVAALFAEGREAMRAGRHAAAEASYRAALERAPGLSGGARQPRAGAVPAGRVREFGRRIPEGRRREAGHPFGSPVPRSRASQAGFPRQGDTAPRAQPGGRRRGAWRLAGRWPPATLRKRTSLARSASTRPRSPGTRTRWMRGSFSAATTRR